MQYGRLSTPPRRKAATNRINQREGHFFKGASPLQDKQALLEDNSEWIFVHVMFPHILLPGINAIEQNSRTIAAALLTEVPDVTQKATIYPLRISSI